MATVAANGKIRAGQTFSNETEVVRTVYDFTKDGGATADKIDLLEADDDMVITSAYLKVLVAGTSGGSATVAIGIEGGTEAELIAATAVAGLTLGALIKKNDSLPLKVAKDAKLVLVIATADLTAGKFELVLEKTRF